MNLIYRNPAPVYPVYSDLTHIVNSTYSGRSGFKYICTPYVEGVTLSNVLAQPDPINGFGYIDPHKILETQLTFDLNYNVVGATSNPNSIKNFTCSFSETFSNKNKIINATGSNNISFLNQLELEFEENHFLRVNDRVKIDIDNPQVTTYNDYYKVLNIVNDKKVIVDTFYVNSPFQITGEVTEGVEFFDNLFSNTGYTVIQTTNNHYFNEGDLFLLQMDTWAVGRVDIGATATTGDVITNITVNGVIITSGAVNYNTTIEQTAQDLVNSINNINTIPNYTAFTSGNAGDGRVFIYSLRENGNTANGFVVSGAGTMPVTYRNMTQTTANGINLNPQFTGVWQVTEVLSPNTFLTNIPQSSVNTVSGSERGTIISLNNYILKDTLTISQKWIKNNVKQYSDFFNYTLNTYLNQPFGGANEFLFISDSNYKTIDMLTGSISNILGVTLSVNTYVNNVIQNSTASFLTFSNINTGDLQQTIGIGSYNINQLFNTSVIDSNTDFYTVDIIENGQTVLDFKFTKTCFKYDYVDLFWLNENGCFDSYLFANIAQYTDEYTRTNYMQKVGKNIDFTWTRRNGDRGLKDYNNFIQTTFKLQTGFINKNEFDYIKSVFYSNNVYMINYSNGELIPVNIINKNLDIPLQSNSDFQVVIEAQISNNYKIQNN